MRVLPIVIAAGLLAFASQVGAQKAFATPEAAATAFIDAAATGDVKAMQAILGADYRRYLPGDIKNADVARFVAAARKSNRIETDGNTSHLAVGDGWTLPIPIVKTKSGYAFDMKAGAEEMRLRRIGRNELAAMQAVLAYYDAQKDYAQADRNGDGVLEYAQRVISTPGKKDGLYWSDADESPLGPLYADESANGVYHGYRFRILKMQGPDAAGGARGYVVKNRMTNGFAAVAWPAKYNDTGIVSFIINHDGRVYQKDLGAGSDSAARSMTRFNPDKSWTAVTVPSN